MKNKCAPKRPEPHCGILEKDYSYLWGIGVFIGVSVVIVLLLLNVH